MLDVMGTRRTRHDNKADVSKRVLVLAETAATNAVPVLTKVSPVARTSAPEAYFVRK